MAMTSANPDSFTLSLQQKRQAALLYHWMSLEYLKSLKALIDAMIKGADVTLELAAQQGRDALIVNPRWGVRDTAANWSTFVYPALEDFRKSTVKDIGRRATESYEFTGATQCARMIDEFSSLWMTEEEEQRFKTQFEVVYQHAQSIDFAAGVGGLRHQLHGSSMALYWLEFGHLFPRLPKYRVRRDVEGVSDKRPPRTGVYVAQDDPFATLQFAWTGNADGVLGDAETLNDTGRQLVSAIGRDSIWVDGAKMAAYAGGAFARGELKERSGFAPGDERDPRWVGVMLQQLSATRRPSKWYFVEPVEGEFDDSPQTRTKTTEPVARERCVAGEMCERAGYWSTPANPTSRQRFALGEIMPAYESDYGSTIWYWDETQS